MVFARQRVSFMQVRAVYGFQATSQLATLTKYSTDMVMDDFTKLV